MGTVGCCEVAQHDKQLRTLPQAVSGESTDSNDWEKELETVRLLRQEQRRDNAERYGSPPPLSVPLTIDRRTPERLLDKLQAGMPKEELRGEEAAAVADLVALRLQSKGITLRQLANFWKKYNWLGKLRTTTKTEEVVRSIVIPETAAHNACYLDVEAGGPYRPQTFVSHYWGANFYDDLLCIAQNATKLDVTDAQAFLNDKAQVEFMVGADKVSAQSEFHCYWMCVFAVNHHASICGDCRTCRQGATWEKWQYQANKCSCCRKQKQYPCSCGSPKIPFDHPVSQIDKFMIVMERVGHTMAAFDSRLCVLSRVWCLGELGFASGMGHDIMIHLPGELDRKFFNCDVSATPVEASAATFPEDKQRILQYIKSAGSDYHEFDQVIAEDIIPKLLELVLTLQNEKAKSVSSFQKPPMLVPDGAGAAVATNPFTQKQVMTRWKLLPAADRAWEHLPEDTRVSAEINRALLALARNGEYNTLTETLRNGDVKVCLALLTTLSHLSEKGDPAIMTLVSSNLADCKTMEVKCAVLKTLAELADISDQRTVDLLLQYCGDGQLPDIEKAAGQALGILAARGSYRAIHAGLQHSKTSVKLLVLETLVVAAQTLERHVVHAVGACLSDPQVHVRRAAEDCLGELAAAGNPHVLEYREQEKEVKEDLEELGRLAAHGDRKAKIEVALERMDDEFEAKAVAEDGIRLKSQRIRKTQNELTKGKFVDVDKIHELIHGKVTEQLNDG
eukprot:TRINITY_DN95111_c0_g1_i1.p1 TRINITY_DN95111_c0_g1~~TRINITY_DN95111_c0_g1_i1.p1  ORF type:complete len:733 (-),score=154.25 TRINITY_DN95111_c0_g1_i1:26-2224(-)